MAKLVLTEHPAAAPATVFADATGKPHSVAEFKGRVAIVNLWANWCAPCKAEIPSLARLASAYAGKPLAIAAVSVGKAEDETAGHAFLDKNPPLTFYTEPTYALAYAFKPPIDEMPTTIIYDRKGVERARLSGGADWSVRLWDPATGQPARLLRRHSDVVRRVAFSPDGAVLASASGDRTLRLWDKAAGWKSRVLRGHSGWVRDVAFSPDGATIASCGNDNTVRLWGVTTGNLVSVLAGHTGEVHGVAFSGDGALLASCGADGVVRVWDPRTEEQLRVLEGHAAVVYDVAFSPVGGLLASASEDKTIRFWR